MTAIRAKAREIAEKIVSEIDADWTHDGQSDDDGKRAQLNAIEVIASALLSSGGIDGEPVAWLVDGEVIDGSKYDPSKASFWLNEDAQRSAKIEPLYRHPVPREAAEGERLARILRVLKPFARAGDFLNFAGAKSQDEIELSGDTLHDALRAARELYAALASPVPGSE